MAVGANFEKVVQALAKKLNDGSQQKVYLGTEVPPMEVVSTGCLSLDFATDIGGIPRGTVVEIFGRESVGKSALTYYMMREQQLKGFPVCYVNIEGFFDPIWAKNISGLDLSQMIYVTPNPGTEAVEVVGEMVSSGAFGMVVFDSIGAMLTDKEAEPGEKKQAGGQSALATHMIKLVVPYAFKNKCTTVFVNQVRDNFDSMYNVEKSPGGHAVKHMAVMRVHMKPHKDKFFSPSDKSQEIGYRVAAKIEKSKVGAPKATAEWNFYHHQSPNGVLGIDKQQMIRDLSLKYGIIEQGGAYYTHPVLPLDPKGDHKMKGKDAVFEYLESNPEAMAQISDELQMLTLKHKAESKVQETLLDGN